MNKKEQKKFNEWLKNNFIKESGHSFGMGFFITLKNGYTMYNGTDEYKEWYDNKLSEYNAI